MKKFKQYLEQNGVVYVKTTTGWERHRKPGRIFAKTSKETPYKSIFGDYLEEMDFSSISHLKKFLRDFPDMQSELFGTNKIPFGVVAELDLEPAIIDDFNVMYFDIETEVHSGFPSPLRAIEPINMITLRLMKESSFDVWTTCSDVTLDEVAKHSNIDKDKIRLKVFETEEEMLWEYINYFSLHDIDIYGGWFSGGFDVPFICNRIINVLGENALAKLSPFGKVEKREAYDDFGKPKHIFKIRGVQHIDMQALYKKRVFKPRENYSLDFIAKVELGEGKLKHESGIPGHKLYMHKGLSSAGLAYNLCDTDRLARIIDQTGILNLIVTLAQSCRLNVEDTEFVTRLIMGYAHLFLSKTDEFLPLNVSYEMAKKKVEGGYVKTPIKGISKYLFSIDIASSYPSGMRAVNISPETKAKHYPTTPDKIVANEAPPITEGFSRAGNGLEFTHEFRGFIPRMLDELYANRQIGKKKKLEHEHRYAETHSEEERLAAKKYDDMDKNAKALLNSCYGAIASDKFIFFDPDVAEAVTLSGQVVVKQMAEVVLKFINDRNNQIKILKKYSKIKPELDFNITLKPTDCKWVYSDTDSCYFEAEDFISQLPWEEKERLDFLVWMADNPVQTAVDHAMNIVDKKLNTLVKGIIKADREVVAPGALFVAKKNYCLAAYNLEGSVYEYPYKMKIQGLPVIKSMLTSACKEPLKDFLRLLILETPEKARDSVLSFYTKFKQMDPDDICMNVSITDLDKYVIYNDEGEMTWGKGCTRNAKMAITHNETVRRNGKLEDIKYIANGDKFRTINLIMPNPVGQPFIAWMDSWPDLFTEIGLLDYIDYETQFNKVIKASTDAQFATTDFNPKIKKKLELF